MAKHKRRPKLRDLLVAELDRRIKLTEAGRSKSIAKREVILRNLLALVDAGDPAALKRLIAFEERRAARRSDEQEAVEVENIYSLADTRERARRQCENER
jgi:hypothetical protein